MEWLFPTPIRVPDAHTRKYASRFGTREGCCEKNFLSHLGGTETPTQIIGGRERNGTLYPGMNVNSLNMDNHFGFGR